MTRDTTPAPEAFENLTEGTVIRVPQYKNALVVTFVGENTGMVGVEFNQDSQKTSTPKHLIQNEHSGRVALVAGRSDEGVVEEIEIVTQPETDEDENEDGDDENEDENDNDDPDVQEALRRAEEIDMDVEDALQRAEKRTGDDTTSDEEDTAETRTVTYRAVVDGDDVTHTVTVEKSPSAAFTHISQRCYAGADLCDRYGMSGWDASDIEVVEARAEETPAVPDGGVTTLDTFADEEDDEEADSETYDSAHYGHVRYAAHDEAGVRWYDPRDGREQVTVPDVPEEADEWVSVARITPYQPSEWGEPADRYKASLQIERPDPELPGTKTVGRSEVFDSLADAKAYLADNVPGYREMPRRDAVATRVESGE